MDPFYFGPDQQLDAAAVDEDDYLTSLGLVLSPAPPAALPLPAGAFEAYQRRVPALLEYNSLTMSGRRYNVERNMHRRMFSYLRRVAQVAAAASTGAVVAPAFPAPADETMTTVGVFGSSQQAPRSSRFRHIMRERLRRERLSQGFADLHALLPPGASSKGGKNDIVGAAAGYIRELGARKEWLSARNEELLHRAATRWSGGTRSSVGRVMVVKVRAESQDHSTVVNASERVLQRLKAMEELQVTAIRSRICAGGMWMNVGVEGQVRTHLVFFSCRTSLTLDVTYTYVGCEIFS
ncbi:transcription factor BHLH148-like isoform X1 [Miscanthus floridulus]|uniref:transcription factor BHLH148-like isoform X1 n=1 Tax=Miscanthus floridulus TaxID=154761 RepID=UPI00345904D7